MVPVVAIGAENGLPYLRTTLKKFTRISSVITSNTGHDIGRGKAQVIFIIRGVNIMGENREMPFFMKLDKMQFVDDETMDHCKSMNDAIAVCILSSQIKYRRSTLADILEIDRAQLSKILNKKGYNFPPNKLWRLMETCGNYAPLQYLLAESGFKDTIKMLVKLAA